MKQFKLNIILCILSIYCCSCASIIHGSRQRVGFYSFPTGANVYINDSLFGTTPMHVSLNRKKAQHHIRLTLDGYEPRVMDIDRVLDGWFVANIFIGGLIGMGIDALSGAMYHFTPHDIDEQLKPVNH